MSRDVAEILVVGGGPAGAATAAHLADRGREVLLLERARFPREKPCAEFLSPGVVECLGSLGLLEQVRQTGAAFPKGMRIVTERGDCVVRYGDDSGGYSALGIPRPIFDEILLNRARAANVQVEEGCRVLGPLVENGAVVGVTTAGPGGPRELRARLVVAADGRYSAIASGLGLSRAVRWPRRLGLVARFAGVSDIADYGELHVGPGTYCGLAPVGNGAVNVGLVVPERSKPAGEPTEHFFQRQLGELPGVGQLLRNARRLTSVRGRGPLAHRVSRIAGPGYLLVGDAAGFFDPFTGEGVYRALRGAELAARLADELLAAAAPDWAELERAYRRVRREAFADKDRVCQLVQLFLSWHRSFDYVVDHLARRPGILHLLSGILGDYEPAAPALRPDFLWSLLRP